MNNTVPFTHIIKEITMKELKQYFQPEVYIKYCQECQYYNKIWTCPPYDFNVEELMEDYQYAYIIGSKLLIGELGDEFKELIHSKDMEYAANEIYKAARIALDKKLVKLADKEQCLMVLYAGRCLLCEHCTREENLPCFQPERTHYSLESIGFDVATICEAILKDKLQWGKESLPEYFLLVSAIFSRKQLEMGEQKIRAGLAVL